MQVPTAPCRQALPSALRDARRNIVCRYGGRGRGRPADFGGGGDGLLLGGGGRGGGLASNRPAPKLVLPGRSGPPTGGGGRLIIPEKGMEKLLAEGAEKLGPEMVTLTGPNRYRPPAGFMNDDGPQESEVSGMAPDEMISRLRSRAGKWHQLAKMLPELTTIGYDSNSIDELTGITPALQNRWAVGATVYDSLVASGQLPPEMIARFDSRGEDLLYPFRFLNQEMRVEAAKYIVEKDLDAAACEVLARAMKEWERRPLERYGFSPLPGDCMAFKYLRDAFECKRLEDGEAKLLAAVLAAVTDSARERLAEAEARLQEELGALGPDGAAPSGQASLTVLRLDPDDIGFRPIPLLGALGEVTEADVEAAPRTTQDGAFGAFAIEGAGLGSRWVALPQWKALALMRHPVAVSMADCAAVPAVVTGTKVKTDDDKKRLSGAGLVVAEKCSKSGEEVDTGSYYLAARPLQGGRLLLLEGVQVQSAGLVAVAKVVFIARPPVRDQPMTTSESMIQL